MNIRKLLFKKKSDIFY